MFKKQTNEELFKHTTLLEVSQGRILVLVMVMLPFVTLCHRIFVSEMKRKVLQFLFCCDTGYSQLTSCNFLPTYNWGSAVARYCRNTEIAELPKCENNLVSTLMQDTKEQIHNNNYVGVQNHTKTQKYPNLCWGWHKDSNELYVLLTFSHKFGANCKV